MAEIRIQKKKTRSSAWSTVVLVLTLCLFLSVVSKMTDGTAAKEFSTAGVDLSLSAWQEPPLQTQVDDFIAFVSDSSFLNNNINYNTVYDGLDRLAAALEEVIMRQDNPDEELLTKQKELQANINTLAPADTSSSLSTAGPHQQELINVIHQSAGLLSKIQTAYFPELASVVHPALKATQTLSTDAAVEMQETQVKDFFVHAGEAITAMRDDLYEEMSYLEE